MIAELGHLALIIALALALVQGVVPLWGAHRGRTGWMALARPATQAQALFVAISYGCLTWSFLQGDFSVALVAGHSSIGLPDIYRFTAVWGNHEGSILLWTLILAGWTAAVSVFSRQLDAPTVARVLGVMGLVSTGFLLFTLFTSNPFTRLIPAPADGQDLNPLLQDAGMILHPPLLYMGYVGFVVAFAFAVAGLLSGRLDAAWARWSRPWTTAAWCFLTLGIALGSFWAYYELGWGGWWFWDPVENASFLPWLVGTALLHSLAVTDQRGGFKGWTALLAILAFSLSLLGTFIVRSGVLSSVHAFATDPARGLFILAFFALVTGGSLALFAWRLPQLGGSSEGFAPASRESLLLSGNVALLAAASAVLLGTVYPLLSEAFGGGKLSVGPPYFNAVFVPLVTPALFLMGVAPLARWRTGQAMELARLLRWAAAVAVATALVAPWTWGSWSPLAALGLGLAAWVGGTSVLQMLQRLRRHPSPRWARRAADQPGRAWGMLLAHGGIAVFIAGVTVVSTFHTEAEVRLEAGQSVEVAGHRFTLNEIATLRGPNYSALRASVDVQRNGAPVTTLAPERRVYDVSRSAMTEVAIDRGLTRDVYVALGTPVSATAWSLRIHHKPLVNWIWGGCVLMALGGALAGLDRAGVRLGRRRSVAPAPSGPVVVARERPAT